jgi:hypothetical protein
VQVSAAAELVLLRAVLSTGPALRVGAVVEAKVLDRGLLALLGKHVAARLPDDVRAGDVLRLHVKEAGAERILLQIVPDPPPAATAAVLLPNGATARLIEDEDTSGGSGKAERTVLLRYDSPELGRIDIRLSLSGATVHATEGAPAEAARAAAGKLAIALGAPVAVIGHRSALDARA